MQAKFHQASENFPSSQTTLTKSLIGGSSGENGRNGSFAGCSDTISLLQETIYKIKLKKF